MINHVLYFGLNLSLRTVKNLYCNLQKPPLPSKIPAYVHEKVLMYKIIP